MHYQDILNKLNNTKNAFSLSLQILHMQTHRLLFRIFGFDSTCACCSCVIFFLPNQLKLIETKHNVSQNMTQQSVSIVSSRAICLLTFFCSCNTAQHHPSNLPLQKAALPSLFCPESSILPAGSCTEKAKLECIYL